MSFNKDTFELMVKFGLAMMGILLLIWLLAAGTPLLAKLADKLLGRVKIDQGASSVPIPERVQGENENGSTDAEREYKVYDIYEGTPSVENENNDKKD